MTMLGKLTVASSFVAVLVFAAPAWSRPPATPVPSYYGEAFDTSLTGIGSITLPPADTEATGSDMGNADEESDAGGPSMSIGGDQAIVVYDEVSPSGNPEIYDEYNEWLVPYEPLGEIEAQFNEEAGPNVTLSDVGFLLSPTYIPLDDLNFNDYPPSSFTPIPSLDGSDNEGSTVTADVVLPEPASIGILGACSALLMRRRRK
jgi:hypothetical protein